MFYTPKQTAKEAGAAISSVNMDHVQTIHDEAAHMGADCAAGSSGSGGWVYEACRMSEAALPMNASHDSLRGHIRAALKVAHGQSASSYSDNGPWVSDVFPSHVVYSHDNQMYKRPYTVDNGAAGSTPVIKLGAHSKVHTAYVDSKESEKESMSVLTDVPAEWIVDERLISKKERQSAESSDFAGKSRSFPILSQEDVSAALRSIGRAGSDNLDAATIKTNILKIAKRKGFKVPTSEQESVIITLPEGGEVVTEGIQFAEDLSADTVKEATADKPIVLPVKIIGPGWGSNAFYSADFIKRSIQEKAWPKGMHMYMNHQTDQESANRPENMVERLAAVSTEDAYWSEGVGGKGPGAYTKAKVFSDHAKTISEKGPHIGASIYGAIVSKNGEAEGRTGKIAEKVLKIFSTDFVTRPGAKGAVVVESARTDVPQIHKESTTMTDQDAAALQTENATLKQRITALESANYQVIAAAGVQMCLREAGLEISPAILNRLCVAPTIKEGKVDPEWIKATAKDVTETFGEAASIRGMGPGRSRTINTGDDLLNKEADTKLTEALGNLGFKDAALAMAVKG